MGLISCKSVPEKGSAVIFPTVPQVYDEAGVPYISYEYMDKEGKVIRSNDLNLKGYQIINTIVPWWLWKRFIEYIIDTEAAIERIEIESGNNNEEDSDE